MKRRNARLVYRLMVCLLASAIFHALLVAIRWERPVQVELARTPLPVTRVVLVAAPADSADTPAVRPLQEVSIAPDKEAVVSMPEAKDWPETRRVAPRPEPEPTQPRPEPVETAVARLPAASTATVPQAVVTQHEEPGPVAATAAESKPSPAARPDVARLIEATPDYASNPLPEYPRLARQKRWEGEAWLRVEVAEDGTVATVTVEESSGHAVLDRSAKRAVEGWRFVPATRGGVVVDSRVRVPVRFRLEGR